MEIRVLLEYADVNWAADLGERLRQEPGAPGITCTLTDVEGLPQTASTMRPDVLLLERPGNGERTRELVAGICAAWPCARVLMLCDACSWQLTIESIKYGASGCMVKSSAPSLVAKAVRAVYRGENWYGRSALLQALQSQICCTPAMQTVEEGKLTPREDEILNLIGAGLSNKEIGRRLEISDKTVKTHLHRVYVKLNQSGRFKAFLAQPGATGGSLTRQ